MPTLRAYSHPKITKDVFVAEIAAHAAADDFIQGVYEDHSGKGCAVGCSIASIRHLTGDSDIPVGQHVAYERYLGVPRILARLEDAIFEGLPLGKAKAWPLRFSTAIPQGADLSNIWNEFCPWMFREIVLPSISEKFPKSREAVERVIKGYETNWRADDAAAAAYAYAAAADAAAAAYAAAAYAAAAAAAAAAATAYAAAAAYAAVAAYAAAAAAAYAAAAAATAYAAYAADARRSAYEKMADKLCELLSAAPVAEA